jgi:hypothetical protein
LIFLSPKQWFERFLIVAGIKTFQQFSGLLAIEAYMQSIIEDTASSISPEISSVIFGIVQFTAGKLFLHM